MSTSELLAIENDATAQYRVCQLEKSNCNPIASKQIDSPALSTATAECRHQVPDCQHRGIHSRGCCWCTVSCTRVLCMSLACTLVSVRSLWLFRGIRGFICYCCIISCLHLLPDIRYTSRWCLQVSPSQQAGQTNRCFAVNMMPIPMSAQVTHTNFTGHADGSSKPEGPQHACKHCLRMQSEAELSSDGPACCAHACKQ